MVSRLFSFFSITNSSWLTTLIIPVDQGGYYLSLNLAQNISDWLFALLIGYVSGATLLFSIPVGLSLIDRQYHKAFAMGILCGLIAIPIAIATSILFIYFYKILLTLPMSAPFVMTTISFSILIKNLLFVSLIFFSIAAGLWFKTEMMINIFLVIGHIFTGLVKILLMLSIVEHFTHIFSYYFHYWPFDPLFADNKNDVRAIEVAGYIGIMLAGAFPLIYLIDKIFKKKLTFIGHKINLSDQGVSALIASLANIIAMFHLFNQMSTKEQVLVTAFAVCGAFMFGDHLAFTANFQPKLIIFIILFKLTGAIVGYLFAYAFYKHLVKKIININTFVNSYFVFFRLFYIKKYLI